MPSKVPDILAQWKDHVAQFSEKASKSLANPDDYRNLFPGYEQSLEEEAERREGGGVARPKASAAPPVEQEPEVRKKT